MREREGPHTYPQGQGGSVKCTVYVELVWGKMVRETSGDTKIVGDVFHELHGPTARKSMDEWAAKMNAEKTPPTRMKKCKVDGSRLPKDGGKDQMFLPLQLRPTSTAP